MADEIFGTPDAADHWVIEVIFSLGNRRLVELLATDAGVRSVVNVLYRIKYDMLSRGVSGGGQVPAIK